MAGSGGGFRIGQAYIEAVVDDSQVAPGIQAALQSAATASRSAAQATGVQIGQQMSAGIQQGVSTGTSQAATSGGATFGTGFARSAAEALKVGLVGVAVSAGAVFMKGFGDAVEQGNVTSKLQVQLGASSEDAHRYGLAAGNLYTHGITDTFEQGAEAIKSIMQQGLVQPGATNAQIQSIAGKVTDLSRTFDIDLSGAANAAGQMIKTGMAKNATEAIDIMTRGAQVGVDKAGDMADTMNEYGVQFHKMGLSGEQAMGMLSQGLKGGARDADLVADSIKEFSIRAVDGSKTTIQGFQSLGLNATQMAEKVAKGGQTSSDALALTLDKLRAIKDPAERSRVAVMLFGTQAEDMGKALYSLDPTTAVNTLGKVGGAADAMGKTLHSGPTQAITVFERTVQQGIVNLIGTYVIPQLMAFEGFLQKTLTPAFNTIKTAVMGFINSLGGVQGIMNTVMSVLTALGKVALAAVLPILVSLADSARKNLVPALQDLWTLIKSNLMPLLQGLVPVVKAIATGVAAAIVPALNALMVGIKGVVGFITQWQNVFVPLAAGIAAFAVVLNVQRAAMAAWAVVTQGVSVVTRAWTAVQLAFNAVMAANPIVLVIAVVVALGVALYVAYQKSQTFRDIVNGAFNSVKQVWNTVWNAIKVGIDWLVNAFSTSKKWIADTWNSAWNSVKSGTMAAWNYVKNALSVAFDFIKNLFLNFTGPGLIIKHWETIKNATMAAWNYVKSAVSAALDWVKSTINTVMNSVKSIWNSAWNSVTSTFSSWWNGFRSAMTSAWAWVTGSFTSAKNAVTRTWSDTWNSIKSTFTSGWNTVKGWFVAAWAWLTGAFTSTKNAVTRTWSDAWNSIKSTFSSAWNAVKGWVSAAWAWLSSAFASVKNSVTAIWNAQWNAIKSTFTTIWNMVRSLVSSAWSWLSGSFSSVKSTVTGLWSGLWNSVYSLASTLWGKIQGGVNSFKNTIVGAFTTAKNMIGTVWNQLSDIAKKPINFIISTVYTHGIKALWDKVAKWVGLGALPDAPKLLAAGGTTGNAGTYNRPTAIVGEGNPHYPEYVIPTDPRHRSRALALYQQAGTQLMDGGGIIGSIWGGIKSAGSGIASGVGDVLSAAKNELKDLAAGALQPFFKAGMSVVSTMLKQVPGASTGFGQLMTGIPKKVATGIMSFLGGKDSAANSASSAAGGATTGQYNGATGAGVQRWTGVVQQALQQLGLAQSWTATVLRRMNQESGGDPNIVNKYDSNWIAGYPSVGLMQVIGPTFRSYAGRYKNTGPFQYGTSVNPLANTYAGLNYAMHAYGSLSALNRPGGYDNGGWLPPGATMAVNKTGKPEAVLTNEQWDRIAGSKTIEVSITLQALDVSSVTKAQAMKMWTNVRDGIREVERAHK